MPTTFETSPPCLPAIVPEFIAQTSPPDGRPLSEERLLAYTLFGAGFVHEVNSPLAIALLSAQVALRSLSTSADPRVRRCLEFTIEGIEMASHAMREVLRHCCDHEAQRFRFDAGDVLRFTTAVVKGFADRNGCHFEWRDCTSPTDVIGNPLELQFAVADVLYGAIVRGARLITIHTTTDLEWLKIVIADDSSDNPIAEVDAVSPNHATDPQYANALLRDLIYSNGGSISHCASPNAGRTVTISLPRPLQRTGPSSAPV